METYRAGIHLDAVSTGHPEVALIQPTWHCLLRFRQRAKPPPGTEAAVAALRESLGRADIARVPPSWLSGRSGDAGMWAVDGETAFPLSRGPGATWTATTCLVR